MSETVDVGKLLRELALRDDGTVLKGTLGPHESPNTTTNVNQEISSRRCPRCGDMKELAQFKSKNSNQGYCKSCQREYGREMYALHHSPIVAECPICLVVTKLVIDHSHVSGQIRDRVCRRCNTGLGMFGDDMDALLRAVSYLAKHFKKG